MEIARDDYLQKLDKVRENGLVKIITGVRRCGKSYLLLTGEVAAVQAATQNTGSAPSSAAHPYPRLIPAKMTGKK